MVDEVEGGELRLKVEGRERDGLGSPSSSIFPPSAFFRHTFPMPTGQSLLREPAEAWPVGAGAFLLLNPRLDPVWRARVLAAEFPDLPAHAWIATSGTGGELKVVALAHSALEASARGVNGHLQAGAGDVWINPLPLFHVGGLGILVRAALSGAAWHGFGPWDAGAFVRAVSECGATLASLVPAQVHDLVRLGLPAPPRLRAVVVGGGAIGRELLERARALGWPLRPSYGCTEAASQVATARGEGDDDWLPLLPHCEARSGDDGCLHISGPSLLTGWLRFGEGAPCWEDPKRDGWQPTRDRGEVRGRTVRVLGRADDLVKIRGELVDIAALERQLQVHVTSGDVCLLIEPDERAGYLLRIVASNDRAAAEAAAAFDIFPPYARPSGIAIGPVHRNALGKTVRNAEKLT